MTEERNRSVNHLFLLFKCELLASCKLFRLCLECKTLGMMELSIIIFKIYRLIEVLMCLFEITLIEVHVTPVEIVVGVVLIEFDSIIVVALGFPHFSKVVIGKTTIFVVER